MGFADTRLDNPHVDGKRYAKRNNGYLVVPTGIAGWNTGMIKPHPAQLGMRRR